jgi:hypothetical protein
MAEFFDGDARLMADESGRGGAAVQTICVCRLRSRGRQSSFDNVEVVLEEMQAGRNSLVMSFSAVLAGTCDSVASIMNQRFGRVRRRRRDQHAVRRHEGR